MLYIMPKFEIYFCSFTKTLVSKIPKYKEKSDCPELYCIFLYKISFIKNSYVSGFSGVCFPKSEIVVFGGGDRNFWFWFDLWFDWRYGADWPLALPRSALIGPSPPGRKNNFDSKSFLSPHLRKKSTNTKIAQILLFLGRKNSSDSKSENNNLRDRDLTLGLLGLSKNVPNSFRIVSTDEFTRK